MIELFDNESLTKMHLLNKFATPFNRLTVVLIGMFKAFNIGK